MDRSLEKYFPVASLTLPVGSVSTEFEAGMLYDVLL